MKNLLTMTAAALLTLGALAAQAEEGVLRVGTEGDAPNWSMAKPDGSVTGFDADIANALCAEMKLQCKFVVQSFGTLIPSMDSDRFDVIISGLGITDERAKQIGYSIPYATTPQYFAVPKGSPAEGVTTFEEVLKTLADKKIGVVNGTTYAAFVQKFFPNATVMSYDSTTTELADFTAGRLDAVFSDSPTWTDFFKTPESADFTRVEVKIGPSIDAETLGHGMGVGMAKGNTALKAKVDAALCTMIKEGKVRTASETWFADDYTIPCSN